MAQPKSGKYDPRYTDWYLAYVEDVRERVKQWGDKRSHAIRSGASDSQATQNTTDLDASLFASGR